MMKATILQTPAVSYDTLSVGLGDIGKIKNLIGSDALNEDGLLPRAIRLLKEKYPGLVIFTDASLRPYTSYGHDGLVRINGVIMKDESLLPLCIQAVAQARAGAYMKLSWYGLKIRPPQEIIMKMKQDSSDGAAIIMVIPGPSNMGMINFFYQTSSLPIATYQVSGNYMFIKFALKEVDLNSGIMMSLEFTLVFWFQYHRHLFCSPGGCPTSRRDLSIPVMKMVILETVKMKQQLDQLLILLVVWITTRNHGGREGCSYISPQRWLNPTTHSCRSDRATSSEVRKASLHYSFQVMWDIKL